MIALRLTTVLSEEPQGWTPLAHPEVRQFCPILCVHPLRSRMQGALYWVYEWREGERAMVPRSLILYERAA